MDPGETPAACSLTDDQGIYATTGIAPATHVLAVDSATLLTLYDLTIWEIEFGPQEISGGDVLTGFNVGYRTELVADVDEDCAVNVVDIEIVLTAFGSTSSPYDL